MKSCESFDKEGKGREAILAVMNTLSEEELHRFGRNGGCALRNSKGSNGILGRLEKTSEIICCLFEQILTKVRHITLFL